jgi:hypothetical protein
MYWNLMDSASASQWFSRSNEQIHLVTNWAGDYLRPVLWKQLPHVTNEKALSVSTERAFQ